jgi:hypothetical protein
MLQQAAFRTLEEQHAVATAAVAAAPGAPAVFRDSTRPSLADTSLPYRDAKPAVEVSVAEIEDSEDDNDDVGDDLPIIHVSTPRPSPRVPSRSPDRKRVASSTGAQSPPKRHAMYFPDGFPDLTRWPPPNDGDGDDSDGKGEGKGEGK